MFIKIGYMIFNILDISAVTICRNSKTKICVITIAQNEAYEIEFPDEQAASLELDLIHKILLN